MEWCLPFAAVGGVETGGGARSHRLALLVAWVLLAVGFGTGAYLAGSSGGPTSRLHALPGQTAASRARAAATRRGYTDGLRAGDSGAFDPAYQASYERSKNQRFSEIKHAAKTQRGAR